MYVFLNIIKWMAAAVMVIAFIAPFVFVTLPLEHPIPKTSPLAWVPAGMIIAVMIAGPIWYLAMVGIRNRRG